MSDALKLCPFCGSQPYAARHQTYSWWAVTCKCGAQGPSFREPESPNPQDQNACQKATAAWQDRAATAPSDLNAAIASAKEEGYQECLKIFGAHMRGIASLPSK